eukprot:TRINITY_DN18085_c0_g1_i1.p1 TRINITY_DN18085_c0_g1~~TRINITY_DN18085_c0_g1_i1.p1  ORF type:complete len:393 (+),score=70.89 TRINITY_DN18085_c0_g1_i1:102-1280(+)
MLGILINFILAVRVSSAGWNIPEGVGWEQTEEPPDWNEHTGSIATALSDGSILLIGGQAGKHGGANLDCFNCTKEVWKFEPADAIWTNISENVPWDPRWGHSVVTTPDDTVWMLFGCCEPDKPTVMFRDIWKMKDDTWVAVDAAPPHEGVQATSVAARGNILYVVGGWSQSRGTLSHVLTFNTDSLEWKTISEDGVAPFPSRADHNSAISPDGSWLYIFGGQHEEGGGKFWTRLKDTWRVPLPDASSDAWEQVGDLAAARSSPAMALLPTGWLITLGGHWTPDLEELKTKQSDVDGMQEHHEATEFQTYNDVLALDIASGAKEWKTLEKVAIWPGRDDCAATLGRDGSLYIFGGGTLYGGGGYHHDTWRLRNPVEVYGLHKTKKQGDEKTEL